MKIIITAFVFLIQIILQAHSTTYYLDNMSGNDSYDGKSYDRPWKTISKVNSITFTPGDKILLKRGSTWYEQLNLKGSGTPGNPILISDYGEGKPPVIDGGLVRELCIWLDRSSYVTVSNIHMQNSTRKGAIRVLRCNNVIVENCTFYVTGHGGVFIENSSTCIIRNNNITTPSGIFNNQTDGIYSQRNDNIIFDNNHIVISNEHPDQHCDGIQSYLDKNIIIRNNYVEQRNSKRSNAQGLYATTMTGMHTYYNNVVYCPNTKSAVVGFRNLKEGKGTLRLYHNTLVGGGSNILFVSEDAGIEAKNNIFYSTGKASIVRLETSQVSLDNNLYYHSGKGDVIGFGKGKRSKDVSEMRIDGFEKNGINADPMLGVEFRPQANSPAKGKAIILGPPYDTDKNGRKRPAGSNPDIGAYQIVN